jgi:anti-sigma B factor antagonist
MEARVEQVGNITVMRIDDSSLDAGNAKDFKRVVAPMVAENRKLVFDLSALQFIDSSGLGAILSCLRQLHALGGDLKLCGVSRAVHALFELVRMHRIIDIHDSREEAVRAFLN